MIEPVQCRMARSALGWSVQELAEKAQIGRATVTRFEGGQSASNRVTVAAIQRVFEEAGIEFIPGGARLRNRGDHPASAPLVEG
jgi:transcriptional regulator with XRE-family HTH domain